MWRSTAVARFRAFSPSTVTSPPRFDLLSTPRTSALSLPPPPTHTPTRTLQTCQARARVPVARARAARAATARSVGACQSPPLSPSLLFLPLHLHFSCWITDDLDLCTGVTRPASSSVSLTPFRVARLRSSDPSHARSHRSSPVPRLARQALHEARHLQHPRRVWRGHLHGGARHPAACRPSVLL